MIVIVDYGLGNVQAFLNVYRRLNIPARTATTPGDLQGASKVVLAGVGAFDQAMARLERSGMSEVLNVLVLENRIPVLGVCVGMQILAGFSEEGTREGLNWIRGSVRCLNPSNGAHALPLPHMGWNDVTAINGAPLFRSLESGARFYFLHSFYLVCDDGEDIAATTSYGSEFCCAIARRNIFGVQFHPEKSHQFGVRLLQNFADL